VLIRFFKSGAVAFIWIFQCSGSGKWITCKGHYHHSAYLEFVEMTKSLYGSVSVIISPGQPTSQAFIGIGMWGQFGHSKGQSCRRVEKPSAVN